MKPICTICHRPLSDPKSIERGMGPVCAGKTPKNEDHDDMIADIVEGTINGKVILRRSPDGKIITNVPHRKVYHSPCGYEWGYGGSGPADLALNILLALYPEEMAWRLHQEFKFKFIACIPRKGGEIPVQSIHEWADEQTGIIGDGY